jgi:hypothetical protein
VIEAGLSLLVQGDSAVAALASVGGFMLEVPKGTALPTWTYRFFGGTPVKSLTCVGGLTMRRCEIDAYGETAAAALKLAYAIDAVLDGYTGMLADEDQIRVDSILKAEEPMDFYDEDRRAFRRKQEYEVWFYDE